MESIIIHLVNIGSLGELDVTHSDVSGGGELDSLLGAGDDDRLAELRQVADHAGELSGGHLDHAGVVSLGDAEVLLVEVHQLHLVVGDLLLVGRLEHEGDIIGLILGLDGDDVIIGSTPSN